MGQLSFEGNQLHDELVERGYALVAHGIPDDAIDELVATYAEFTDNLPDPSLETIYAMIKDPGRLDDLAYENDRSTEWHKYRTNHPFVFKPGGYTNRSLQTKALREIGRVEIADDPKEYYHFLPSGLVTIRQQHGRFGWGALPPEVVRLHQRFASIHYLGLTAMQKVCAQLEEQHPELMSKVLPKRDLIDSPIRLLFYHPGQGDLLAEGHHDKSVGTIQIAESHMGLRLRKPGNLAAGQVDAYKADPLSDPSMQLVRRPASMGVFFPSRLLTLPHVYPDSVLESGWHDVVNLSEFNEGRSLHGKNCARWAIIFFANSRFAGEIGKELTHTGMDRPLPVAPLVEQVA